MDTPQVVTVPRWVMWLFTALQPVIAAGICAGVAFVFSLNQQVVILNVKMEQAIATIQEVRAIDHKYSAEIGEISDRVARLEGERGRVGRSE